MKTSGRIGRIGRMGVALVAMLVGCSTAGAAVGTLLSQAEAPRIVASGTNGVTIVWTNPAANYSVLRSTNLGWSGYGNMMQYATNFTYPLGQKTFWVSNVAGLEVGDMVEFNKESEDYYVGSIPDSNHITLSYGRASSLTVTTTGGTNMLDLSGCWIKDYSAYEQIALTTDTNWTDSGLVDGRDYFYVIGYRDGSGITNYSIPVGLRMQSGTLYFDLALGCAGGYAWKVEQDYSDLPGLIDGNDRTEEIRLQVADPRITYSRYPTYSADGYPLGMQRFMLQQNAPIAFCELHQSGGSQRIQATTIVLEDSTGATNTYALSNYWVSTNTYTKGNVYRLPVTNLTDQGLTVSVTGVTNDSNYYLGWPRFSIFSTQQVLVPVVSANRSTNAAFTVNFTNAAGRWPKLFGTDHVWNSTSGNDAGYMLQAVRLQTNLWTLIRDSSVGDGWPGQWVNYQKVVGYLATNIGSGELTFALTNLTNQTYFSGRTRIGEELFWMSGTWASGSNVTFTSRGYEATVPVAHLAGEPVYCYSDVGQVGTFGDIWHEFPVVRYEHAYASGYSSISTSVDISNATRVGTLTLVLTNGTYGPGDVIQMSGEKFKVVSVVTNGTIYTNEVQRGYDGTADLTIQSAGAVGNIVKYIGHRPYYDPYDLPCNPNYATNLWFDQFAVAMDRTIKTLHSRPWLITWCPQWAGWHRGVVSNLSATVYRTNGVEYALTNTVRDWYMSTNALGESFWRHLSSGKTDTNDISIGGTWEYGRAQFHILTGLASNKVFHVRTHTSNELRIVLVRNDTATSITNPVPVDLWAEGLRPGDVYMVKQRQRDYPSTAPHKRQATADAVYGIAQWVLTNYAGWLNGPIFVEHFNEPNLGTYGTWTLDSYTNSFNILANTLRNGGSNHPTGFATNQVMIGAGSIAGGLDGAGYASDDGPYIMATKLIDCCPVLDFLSHHRYYTGARTQKRQNAFEYRMFKRYASGCGKPNLWICDSEDSVATAGGTGSEEARHYARYGTTYWMANFINSYTGDFGSQGALDTIIHFRNYHQDDTGFGMFAPAPWTAFTNQVVMDLVYWPMRGMLDRIPWKTADVNLYRGVKTAEQYGWVDAMGLWDGTNRLVFIVNKKDTGVRVSLELSGTTGGTNVPMYSAVGMGTNQTIGDGYFLVNYAGYRATGTENTNAATVSDFYLEPLSANIIALGGTYTPPAATHRVSYRGRILLRK